VVKSGNFYIFLVLIKLLKVINLIGTYDCKADAKGRVLFPAAFKKQVAPILQDGFVLKKSVFEKCLELYPLKEWNATMDQVNRLNKFKKKNNDFIRRFTAGVKLVELDATGRILIPKSLSDFAGIKKQVVMSSSVNIIEIWDKERYENVIENAAENFSDLAEEVMGNTDLDELS